MGTNAPLSGVYISRVSEHSAAGGAVLSLLAYWGSGFAAGSEAKWQRLRQFATDGSKS
jgi:hypothetical protein